MSNPAKLAGRALAGLLKSPLTVNTKLAQAAYHGFGFSQFGEDTLIQKMFKLPVKGFYVDVGAYEPVLWSNTYRLYLRGWDGVSVEPNPEVARRNQKVRARATTLNVGVASKAGKLLYYMFDHPNLNTFSQQAAETASRAGAHLVEEKYVEVVQINDLLDRYCKTKIDVFSLDVEGMDLDILRSMDFRALWKPNIMLVEDHVLPGEDFWTSPISIHLLSVGYKLVARAHFTSIFVLRSEADCLMDSNY